MKTTKFAVISLLLILTGCWDTGNGEKIGMITKLAEQGAFGCPTWEAEIVRGGFNGGSGVNGQSFHFTIEDKSLLPKVKQAMESQQEVKIKYQSEMVTICRSDSGNHFLTSIEPIESRPAEVTVGQILPETSKSSVSTTPTTKTSSLDRQKIADQISKSNQEILRQNQQLIDLLKK